MFPKLLPQRPAGRAAALALSLLGLAAVAWLAWHPGAPAVAAAAAPAPVAPGSFRPSDAQFASLTIAPVRSETFDAVVTTDGSVAVNDNATVGVFSQFSGRITALHVQPGDAVRRGAPLATLLATEPAQAGSDIAAATSATATARKQLELAQATEQRQHELFLAEAGAEKDWRQSQSDLVAAQGTLHAAEVALAAARAKAAVLGTVPGDRGEGSGQAVIASPIDGVVVQRQAAPGQYVNSLATGASTPLFTVSDLRRLWVLGNVAEADVARIHVGQPVEINALALGTRTLRASVAWIASTLDPATHRVAIRAELSGADAVLKPLMSVTLRVLEAHPAMALAVPRSALVYDGAEVHCYVAQPDHTLVLRKLQLGRVQDGRAEVKAGLAAGEQVVTRGTLFIDRAAQDDNA